MMRRLCVAAGLAALLAAPAAAQGPYPSQPLKLIVPYPAGGATDTLARTIGQKLQEAWGQTAFWWRTGPAPAAPSATTFVAKAPPTATPC